MLFRSNSLPSFLFRGHPALILKATPLFISSERVPLRSGLPARQEDEHLPIIVHRFLQQKPVRRDGHLEREKSKSEKCLAKAGILERYLNIRYTRCAHAVYFKLKGSDARRCIFIFSEEGKEAEELMGNCYVHAQEDLHVKQKGTRSIKIKRVETK